MSDFRSRCESVFPKSKECVGQGCMTEHLTLIGSFVQAFQSSDYLALSAIMKASDVDEHSRCSCHSLVKTPLVQNLFVLLT